MKAALLIIALLCSGCAKQAETTERVGVDFEVSTLFTKDGCTVYRFSDGGYNRYFTNCTGSTIYRVQTGKSSRDDGVSGGGRP